MSTRIQAVRGMNDVLPEHTPLWEFFEDTVRDVFRQYGYTQKLRTKVVDGESMLLRPDRNILRQTMY